MEFPRGRLLPNKAKHYLKKSKIDKTTRRGLEQQLPIWKALSKKLIFFCCKSGSANSFRLEMPFEN